MRINLTVEVDDKEIKDLIENQYKLLVSKSELNTALREKIKDYIINTIDNLESSGELADYIIADLEDAGNIE